MKAVYVRVRTRSDTLVEGEFNTIDAINELQRAIDLLRQASAPLRDLSFGESPMPVLGPSASELAEFVRRN